MKISLLLLFPLFLFAFPTSSSGSYCICKEGLSDQILQKAIDYACGAGADCNPIRPNGQCYNPNTVVNHCSYAVNNYFQKKAATGATCDFGGAAQLTNAPPSGSCLTSGSTGTGSTGTGPVTTVPSTTPISGGTPTTTPISGGTPTTTPTSGGTSTTTPVSGGTGGTGGIGTGGTGIGVTPTTGTTPTTTSPYGTTPTSSGGILGGGVGMAPTGSSMDDSASGIMERASLGSILATILISGIMCWLN